MTQVNGASDTVSAIKSRAKLKKVIPPRTYASRRARSRPADSQFEPTAADIALIAQATPSPDSAGHPKITRPLFGQGGGHPSLQGYGQFWARQLAGAFAPAPPRPQR